MPDTVADQIDIKVTTVPDVPQADVRRARDIVTRVLARAPRPVLYAKATLNVLPGPAVARPNLVSLQIDLDGLPVSAHASAASMGEAVSLATARLRARRGAHDPVLGDPPNHHSNRPTSEVGIALTR